MIDIHCGSWVCNGCILTKADEIKKNSRPPYEIQTIDDPDAPNGVHYRVSHAPTDSRIATCYLKENAGLVCQALNKMLDR
jgi:hypothetical protein